jgi:protocatechuate 3,4-dioxygenase beta subunit
VSQGSGAHEDALLGEVLAAFADAPDRRLAMLIARLVKHLHAYARGVQLNADERRAAIRFFTAVGQKSGPTRQEFELLSDVLGLSSLVETMGSSGTATLQTLTGPLYAPGAPRRAFGESMVEQDGGGAPAVLEGRVTGAHGQPLADAELDVWQTAENQLYAVQDPDQPEGNLRGRYRTRDDGRYEIRTIRPVPYRIPEDGPVGALLRQTNRHPWRAAHIHLIVTHTDHVPLTTELFDAESDYLDSDAVFGVAPELVRPFAQDDGLVRARFDIVLAYTRPAT